MSKNSIRNLLKIADKNKPNKIALIDNEKNIAIMNYLLK